MKINPNDILTTAHRILYLDSQTWLRPMAVIGVLLMSMALPITQSVGRLNLFLGLLIALAGVLTFIRWPPLSLMVLIFAAVFIPSPRLPGGVNIAVFLVLLVIALWLLEVLVSKNKSHMITSATLRPALIFILISLLSFIGGQISWFVFAQQAPLDAQLGGLAIYLLSIGTFLLMAYRIHHLRWLEALVWLFILIGAVFIIGRLLGRHGYFITNMFQRSAVSGSMFWTWLVVLALSQAIFNHRLAMSRRVLLGGLVLATFYVAYFQSGDWKSGWIPPLFGAAIILGLRFWRQARYLAPLAVFPAWNVVNQAIAAEQYSWGTRVDAWFIVAEIVKVNPILGLGFANYYWYTPLFPIRGWYVSFNSHSQYVDIFAQTGLLGMVCLLWFFCVVSMLGWRLRERVPEGFARAYVYGALGGLVGTFVAGFIVDWFLPFVYNIGLNGFRVSLLAWVFLGGLVSIEQIFRNKKSSQSSKNIAAGGKF